MKSGRKQKGRKRGNSGGSRNRGKNTVSREEKGIDYVAKRGKG